MTAPHPTSLALYDALGPGITVDDGGTLLSWLDGPAALLGEVDDVVGDTDAGPGWSRELTVTGSRNPRWTAQLLGVQAPPGATDAQVRQLLSDRPAFRRGTPGAIIAAAAALLTGTRYVGLRERDGSAYRLTVVTYTGETPNAAAVNAALQAAKPAGLVLTHQVVTPTSYTAMEAMAPLTYTDLEAQPALTYSQQEAGS